MIKQISTPQLYECIIQSCGAGVGAGVGAGSGGEEIIGDLEPEL